MSVSPDPLHEILHIVIAISNPLLWASRIAIARSTIASWLLEPNVNVTIVECAYGSRSYELQDLVGPRVTHIPVRATTLAWCKECLQNIGISRLPQSAVYIGTFDADVQYRQPGWALQILHALQLYPVVQPWITAYDLGPQDTHIQAHTSFASLWHQGKPVRAYGKNFWKFDGGYYDYAHSGFAWAWNRSVLDKVGGLFEVGGMGSGDHHMALSLAGKAEASLPGGVSSSYLNAVLQWQSRALVHVNQKIGYIPRTIEHQFHGDKTKRAYLDRWDIFVAQKFDPTEDLKRNTYGVLEFSGNKPDLERTFDNYLRSRQEDANTIG